MRVLLNISRFIVGVLFIFSGLVKANDPLGLSYKMQEFFEVWGWHGLHDFTLAFSIIIIAFEIIAGMAVLIGWQFRLFSWLLLLLIIFFTFLTGYAVLSGDIKECGCFGDCIKLTAWDSFIKDLVLTGLIVLLFLNRHKVQPLFSRNANIAVLLVTTLAALWMQWHVLEHLPLVDCLPYKKGNNVLEKMKIPPGAIPDSSVITFVYRKDGKDIEFTADKFPDDFGDQYTFVKRYDKLVRKGNAQAAIRDFSLKDSTGMDVTNQYFSMPGRKVLLFVRDIPADLSEHAAHLNLVYNAARELNADFSVATSTPADTKAAIDKIFEGKLPLNYLSCDAVAIKTASRSSITIYLINDATVVNKWAYEDANKAASEIREQ
ncbi:MAG TPA: BT_3928 family protein [Chitinophagaceae bacterium]|nr:BT_3928 family protein [Chitinophagaceae bacterium]